MDSLIAILPDHLMIYGQMLKDFDAVRNACFGSELEPDYEIKIRQFKETCHVLPKEDRIATPKMHIVWDHIAHFIAFNGPLGPFAEQSFESIHYEWFEFWKTSYKRDMNDPNYGEQVLKAVVDFNTLRI